MALTQRGVKQTGLKQGMGVLWNLHNSDDHVWRPVEMWWYTSQKPDFVFRRNGRVYLKRRGRQFSRLLAAEVCASAVVMLDTPCSEVVWRVPATHPILLFPLHFPSRASPCAITFQLASTTSLDFSTWLLANQPSVRVVVPCLCLWSYSFVKSL